MKPYQYQWGIIFWLLLLFQTPAAVLYVDLNSTSPTPPYADWSTAAVKIQDAVDASTDGDQILVTNGVYQTGGRVVDVMLTNRVVVGKAVTVQSVNGPAVTLIQGYRVPGVINGDSAVRCAYLTDGAALIGFTLTNGATRASNDPISKVELSGGGVWCQSTNAVVSNCLIVSNSCYWWGAGAYAGTLSNCSLNNNVNRNPSEGGGGGAAFSTLLGCTINGNTVGDVSVGGGALSCVLSNCVLTGNSYVGAYNCKLSYCTISSNIARLNGGGADNSVLDNCVLYNNRATNGGGGAYNCALNFCTVSNNWAGSFGGGIYDDGGDTNGIGQHNLLVGNSSGGSGGGMYLFPIVLQTDNGNLSIWTFTSNSAAGAGGGLYLSSGNFPTAILRDCFFTGNSAGGNGGGIYTSSPFSSALVASNCTFSGNLAGGSGGGAYSATLNNCVINGNQAGDGGGGVYGLLNNCVLVGNRANTNGGGAYFSGTSGLSTCTNCTFTNNAAANGGGAYCPFVALSNCVFFANAASANGGGVLGGTVKNCLMVSNQAAFGGGGYGGPYTSCNFIGNAAMDSGGGVYSMPPAAVTACLFGNNSATNNGGGIYGGTLSGCTIYGNFARSSGGGAASGLLTSCIVSNNWAGTNGGGTYNSTLHNCLLIGNSARDGGGAFNGPINNSTLVGNVATNAGGGAYFPSGGGIVSCIIYYNSAPNGTNYSGTAAYNYCCTTPLPPAAPGNITNEPVFINLVTGNLRLQTNSPCINAGNGSAGTKDLDGRPRVVGGKIDMGAYEFQGAGMGEFIAWLQQYGLPTDGTVDFADADGDGFNNFNEWRAGTSPADPSSLLKMTRVTNDVSGITVTWQSVSGITYFLQSGTDLGAQPAFSTIQTDIAGQAGTTSYTDTTATGAGPYFYRVGVQ